MNNDWTALRLVFTGDISIRYEHIVFYDQFSLVVLLMLVLPLYVSPGRTFILCLGSISKIRIMSDHQNQNAMGFRFRNWESLSDPILESDSDIGLPDSTRCGKIRGVMQCCVFMCRILAPITPAGIGLERVYGHGTGWNNSWIHKGTHETRLFLLNEGYILCTVSVCAVEKNEETHRANYKHNYAHKRGDQMTRVHLRVQILKKWRGFLRSSIQLAKCTSQTYSYRLYLSFPMFKLVPSAPNDMYSGSRTRRSMVLTLLARECQQCEGHIELSVLQSAVITVAVPITPISTWIREFHSSVKFLDLAFLQAKFRANSVTRINKMWRAVPHDIRKYEQSMSSTEKWT